MADSIGLYMTDDRCAVCDDGFLQFLSFCRESHQCKLFSFLQVTMHDIEHEFMLNVLLYPLTFRHIVGY